MALNKKEERQQRREQRQQSKIDKYKAGLKEQPTIDIGPLGAERKANIDKRISDYAGDEFKEGLSKFQGLYKAPEIEVPKKPTYEPTIKDVRKSKRAKIADILTAFGKGMQGHQVNPTEFRDRLNRKRSEDYLKYKDIATKGKQQLDIWSNKYTQDQLNYLEGLKKTETSPLKQQKIQAEINKLKADADASKALAESRRKTKTTTKTTTNKGPYPTYEYKTGEGQTIKIPMPGDKQNAILLNNAILSANKLKEARDNIQTEMDNAIYRAEGGGWFGKSKEQVQEEIRQQYADRLQQANEKVNEAESKIMSIFEGDINNKQKLTTNKSESTTTPTENKSKTKEQKEIVDPWEL